MDDVYSGISCNLDKNILTASYPLFLEGSVEAIEWSFDALFKHSKIPEWFDELLYTYGKKGRLVGHGVYYSLFGGKFTSEQKHWLEQLSETASKYEFDHITEHFGFMTGENFHNGAPLSVPMSELTLAIACDRIARMQEACKRPVGLENLAFCYDLDSLNQQGAFLRKILKEVDGFIILDLHNIYCQVENFKITFEELINRYPLELVREIHISGGSWENSNVEPRKIRRDTHDDAVPEEVFSYLKKVIPKVPNLKFVILEQLGSGLETAEKRLHFQRDFREMRKIVTESKLEKPAKTKHFFSEDVRISEIATESTLLAKQQADLHTILENSEDFAEVKFKLAKSSLRNTHWQIEKWEDTMLETAFLISQKWKEGFN